MDKVVSVKIAKLLKKRDYPQLSGYFQGYVVREQKITSPTIAEVVMWLYENYGIWIYADSHEFGKWCYNYKFNRPHELNPRITENGKFSLEDYNSPTEAYEAAIEYTLNNLI